MKSNRVFGEIPPDFVREFKISVETLESWMFEAARRYDQKGARAAGPAGPDAGELVATLTGDQFDALRKFLPPNDGRRDSVSIDVPLSPLSEAYGQHWESGIGGSHFGTRRHATALLNGASGVDPAAGRRVGVIILDVGLNAAYIDHIAGPGHYGGGFFDPALAAPVTGTPGHHDPHKRASDVHGNMIARNVLRMAPSAVVYDAPVLPDRVYDVDGFASVVVAALNGIQTFITDPNNGTEHENWILVNAWAVATRFADLPGPLAYADRRAHRLNAKMIELANLPGVDVVFAGGNSGAFQPARFAGPYDRGHARSIWGANGLEEVFTIGAVRTDSHSIGASSQGPSLRSLTSTHTHNKKPDFCAPSWFAEDDDRSVLNTGTSAASGIFAGFLAAVRSGAGPLPQNATKAQMIAGASGGNRWNAQRGYGVPA